MEFLKKIIGDELYASLTKALEGKEVNLVNTKDGNWIPKDKYKAATDTIKEQKAQLTERDTQLETLKKGATSTEELTKTITELQEKNKKAETDYENKVKQLARDYAIREALTGAEAHDAKTVLPLLNMDELKFEDGKLSGLEGQLEEIKKNHTYLFKEKEGAGGGANPNNKETKTGTFADRYAEALKNKDQLAIIMIKQEAAEAGVPL